MKALLGFIKSVHLESGSLRAACLWLSSFKELIDKLDREYRAKLEQEELVEKLPDLELNTDPFTAEEILEAIKDLRRRSEFADKFRMISSFPNRVALNKEVPQR